MREVDDGGKKRKKKKKKKKIMTFIVATNVVASQPPERRPTGTPHARAKIMKNKGYMIPLNSTVQHWQRYIYPQQNLMQVLSNP